MLTHVEEIKTETEKIKIETEKKSLAARIFQYNEKIVDIQQHIDILKSNQKYSLLFMRDILFYFQYFY